MSNIRVHTTKYGNIQVIYEYIGYMRIHRSNKNEMYYFSLYISFPHVRSVCYEEFVLKITGRSLSFAGAILSKRRY